MSSRRAAGACSGKGAGGGRDVVRDDRARLEDILEAIERIERYASHGTSIFAIPEERVRIVGRSVKSCGKLKWKLE